ETFTNINDTSPQTLSISDNQYFQYNFEFLTENPAYAPRLYSVTVAYDAAPSISLTSPANDSSTSDTTPDFTFNANDDDQPTLNCELFINDGACGTDNSVTSGSSTTLTSNQTLPLGDYYWYVDCSDGTFTTQSETRNLTIITQPSQSSGRDSLSVETEGRCINQAVKITVEREGEKEQEVEIKVTYYGPSLNQLYEIETDSNGQVSFTPTKEGKYRIVAKKNDCKKEKIYIEIEQCEPPCTSNNDCLSTENCISDNCIPITGECGYAENHEWTNYECCSDNQCAEDQTCSGNKCTLIPCECGIILQRTCIGFECCSNTDCSEKELCEGYECIPAECTINSDCSKNETCSQGSCILVAGDCGYISEHEWIAYECCLDFDCKQGENCSEHICKSIILSTEEKEKADALINDAGTFLKEITTKGETNEKADLLLTASKHLLEQEDYLLAGALASMAKNEITETKLATTEYASAENDQGIFSFMGTTSATILFVLLFAAWAWVIVSRTKLT
ncbi:hypothetical protein KAW38_01750, partial [Candidatus Micrarchaeota archaeon]|nr:hypothetical protein [Candidatus Micrarchaeota archaeon]